MRKRTSHANRLRTALAACLAFTLLAAPMTVNAGESHSFETLVFDIDAAPNGGIIVADALSGTIHAIRKGEVRTIAGLPVPTTSPPSTLNGIAAIGNGNFFATTGGGDLAAGAKLWRVSRGNARVVADIEAFEAAQDPDATIGPAWKDPACESDPPAFSAGPQSNPYHLAALSGGEVLVADAAGNSLLAARTNGRIEVVAVFTPPVAGGGSSTNPGAWLEHPRFPGCHVQPVPTSVDIGPDGAYYVGELTGEPATPGLSRVWRIDPGARNVTCPSTACQLVVSGLTSVIDAEFGPDGGLYVVEYDAKGWLAGLGSPGDGTVKRCDVGSGDCLVVADGLVLPGAITFDTAGTAWIVENTFAPTVRTLP